MREGAQRVRTEGTRKGKELSRGQHQNERKETDGRHRELSRETRKHRGG